MNHSYRDMIELTAHRRAPDGCPPAIINSTTADESTNININIRGTIFRVNRHILTKIPGSRLAKASNLKYLQFDRNPKIFDTILDSYVNGEVHVPDSVCINYFRKELEFWEIPERYISSCCLTKIIQSNKDAQVREAVRKEMSYGLEEYELQAQRAKGWTKFKLNLWISLEEPNRNLGAKIWAIFIALCALVSIFLIVIPTVPSIRKDVVRVKANTTIPRHYALATRAVWRRLMALDYAINFAITVDLFLRFSLNPKKLRFFLDFLNLLDLVAVIAVWSFLPESLGQCKYPEDLQAVLLSIPSVRIICIFRLTRTFYGLRILLLVLKRSVTELITLWAMILSCMFIFAFLLFVVEIFEDHSKIRSLPLSLWWAIVTLSTLGYGDVTPITYQGYIVAAMCVICGIILTGLAVPIIGNNFMLYYTHVNNYLKEKELREHSTQTLDNQAFVPT